MRHPIRTFLLGALAALSVAGAPAQAPASVETGGRAGRNVYAAGGHVRPAAAIPGDFGATGGRVTLDQPVGADAMLAGGAVDVRAPVAGDLRAVGGDVNVEARVGGELFAAGGNVAVRPAAAVAGLARLYGANVVVEGPLAGDLDAAGEKVTINGEVRGNVHVEAGAVELGPLARIGGNLRYSAQGELKKAEGATVAGTLTREPLRGDDRRQWRGAAAVGGPFSYIALLACAAVFLLVAPLFSAQAPRRIQASPWLALGVGFGSLVAVPMLAVLLFITVLGIPLGVAVMALYPVLLLAGFIVGVLFVARLIPPALRKPQPATLGRTLGWFALALLLVLLAALVPVAGALVLGLVSVAGIGACVLELYARRKGPGTPESQPETAPLVAGGGRTA